LNGSRARLGGAVGVGELLDALLALEHAPLAAGDVLDDEA
jgi:hypothetical protein